MNEVLKPINDIVLVAPSDPQGKTAGGIVVPASVQQSERVKRGIVAAVGNGRLCDNGERAKMQVVCGDTVAYLNRPKSEYNEICGFLIMQETDIMMVIKEQE